MDIISLAINISKVESMVDHSLKMTVYTQELGSEEMSKLFQYHQKQCFAIIGENPVAEIPDDIDKAMKSKGKEGKSHSQRLRSAMYIWRGQNSENKTFEQFYEEKMEQLINHVKSKIL